MTLQHADHTVLGVEVHVSQPLTTLTAADLELAPRVRYVLRDSLLCFFLLLRQPAPPCPPRVPHSDFTIKRLQGRL